MAKDRERKQAKVMYLKGKSQKEIAAILKVQEKTVSNWVNKQGWKAEREARINSSTREITNLRQILARLTERKIENMKLVEKAEKEKNEDEVTMLLGTQRNISDEYSKWNKRLLAIEDKNKVPLATYIQVMEDVFKDLQRYSPQLFMKTIGFQEQHIENISLKYSI